jgi:hypothetical protein
VTHWSILLLVLLNGPGAAIPLAVQGIRSAATVVHGGADAPRASEGVTSAGVLISEVVTDPQQDWDDSAGGDGFPFNDVPGTGLVSTTDEWIEIVNASGVTMDLTGWMLEMIDATPVSLTLSGSVTAVLTFSPGSSLAALQPDARLVIGNPPGDMSNSVYLVLRDAVGTFVDDVEIGDDFEADGAGDGAPAPGENGNATGLADEAIARYPDAVDTDDDVADFEKRAATIGAPNDQVLGVASRVPPDVAAVSFVVHPLPLRGSGTLTFNVHEACEVDIAIMDPGGRRVGHMVGIRLEPGRHRLPLAEPRENGVYWIHVRGRTAGGERIDQARMIEVVR